jgi:hypothetical protein
MIFSLIIISAYFFSVTSYKITFVVTEHEFLELVKHNSFIILYGYISLYPCYEFVFVKDFIILSFTNLIPINFFPLLSQRAKPASVLGGSNPRAKARGNERAYPDFAGSIYRFDIFVEFALLFIMLYIIFADRGDLLF